MAKSSSTRSYEDFQPSSNLLREEEVDTFVVNLPDFRRDQLRVQIESHGNLKVSGERFIADNRWSRFRKDCLIPKNRNENEIKANFVNGVLYIKMPKSITQVSTIDQAMPKQQAPSNQKTESEQKSEKVNSGVTDQKTAEDARNEINGIDEKDEKDGSSEPSIGGNVIGSLENQVIAPQKQTSYRFGMGMMRFRFKEPRVIVNVAVAIVAVVAVALGLYAKYRLKHSAEAEN